MRVGTIVLVVVVVALLALVVVIYNGLVSKKNAVENAFGGMDVQLKKRYDLVPNLVATAKTYMTHEKTLLEQIVALRNTAANSVPGSVENLKVNGELSGALRGFNVAVENYPELRSVEAFTQLQRSLNEVEEQLAAARRSFNAAVTDYNNGLEQFPSNVFASRMGYQRKSVFETADAERANVSVGKLFQ